MQRTETDNGVAKMLIVIKDVLSTKFENVVNTLCSMTFYIPFPYFGAAVLVSNRAQMSSAVHSFISV